MREILLGIQIRNPKRQLCCLVCEGLGAAGANGVVLEFGKEVPGARLPLAGVRVSMPAFRYTFCIR